MSELNGEKLINEMFEAVGRLARSEAAKSQMMRPFLETYHPEPRWLQLYDAKENERPA